MFTATTCPKKSNIGKLPFIQNLPEDSQQISDSLLKPLINISQIKEMSIMVASQPLLDVGLFWHFFGLWLEEDTEVRMTIANEIIVPFLSRNSS
ncbi:hypothetical protein ACJX0J_041163, partial [Zea mays]